jgi:hypothetical protein
MGVGLRGSASRLSQSAAGSRSLHIALGRNDGQTSYAIDRGRRHEERPSQRRFCGHFAGCLGADDFDVAIFDWTLGCALTSTKRRDLIRERTGEGRKRAQANGVKCGRKPKLSDYQRKEAMKRRAARETLAEIAKSYAVDLSMISRLS